MKKITGVIIVAAVASTINFYIAGFNRGRDEGFSEALSVLRTENSMGFGGNSGFLANIHYLIAVSLVVLLFSILINRKFSKLLSVGSLLAVFFAYVRWATLIVLNSEQTVVENIRNTVLPLDFVSVILIGFLLATQIFVRRVDHIVDE